MAFSVQTVEKRRYIFFQERGRGWETKCQHICSANASHLWLSASLAVWVSQLESAVSRLLADGTSVLYFCLLVKGLNAMSL